MAPVLGPGHFAPVIRVCKAGAADFDGLFYSLASAHDETLFDVLLKRPHEGPKIVESVRAIEKPWQSKTHFETKTVGDVRRLFVSDDEFHKLESKIPFNWQELEKKTINVPFCRQHFDLHGLNVLIRNGVEPLIIDYGEVDVGPACVDALILELCVLFHPSAENLRKSWPTGDQAKNWDDVSIFSKGSPIAAYISECRKWAHDIAERDNAVFATVYSFAVRQLKYAGTRHDLALAIAEAAFRRLTN